MRRYWLGKVAKVAVIAPIALGVLSFVVMSLWNWLMPALFVGVKAVTFWQALGLLVLSRLLFGGFHRHGGGGHWRHRMGKHWAQMTPEERERLHERLHHRGWGRGAPETPDAKL